MESVPGYQLIGRIASGPTGAVWKGSDLTLGRDVALKELITSAPGSFGRMRSEAAILARLQHENIVQVFGLVEADDRSWLVEEWIDGATLTRVQDQAGRLTAQQALGLMRGALSGLAYAHSAGVVHGDISPGNILIDRNGVSKLIDFGLATHPDSDDESPSRADLADPPGGSSGTPGYASPEALSGRTLDARSDVYSCGRVLVGLLAGPISSDTGDDHDVGALRTRGIAPDVATVIARAQLESPAGRYADAGALLADLEAAAERSYGVGWLASASVTTVVASAIAAAAASAADPAAVAAGAPSGGGSAPPAVPARPATGRVDPTEIRSISAPATAGRSVRPWLIAGTAALAVAVVVGVVFLVNREPADTAAPTTTAPVAAGASSSAPASSTPSTSSSVTSSAAPNTTSSAVTVAAAPNPAAALDGTYSVVRTITQITGENVGAVGDATETTWTAEAPAYCANSTPEGCLVRVTTVEDDVLGGGINFSYANGAWSGGWMPSLTCGTSGSVTGTIPASSSGTLTRVDSGAGPAMQLTGTVVTTADGLTCGGAQPPVVEYALVLTRVG